jgi:hypothetical protein
MRVDTSRLVKIDEGRPEKDVAVVYADNGETAIYFASREKAQVFVGIHNDIVMAPPVTVEIDPSIRITDLIRGLTSAGLTFESKGGTLRIVKFVPVQVAA